MNLLVFSVPVSILLLASHGRGRDVTSLMTWSWDLTLLRSLQPLGITQDIKGDNLCPNYPMLGSVQ